MSDLINFNAQLPSFLANADVRELNKGLTMHDTASFPVFSIRGKQFRIVRNGEEKLLMNPKDDRSAAQYITVVLVKIPEYTAKTYYESSYDSGATENQKPVCFSYTGVLPDASVEAPCNSNCKLCPKNQFGSSVSVDGAARTGKACRDSIRMAVAAPNRIDDPILFRVPPTSIKALGQLGRELTARKVPYNAVLVEISFDPDSDAQKLVFRPVGFVNQEQYAQINEVAQSDVVKQITGVTDDVLDYMKENMNRPVAQPAPAPAPQPATAVQKAVATGFVTADAVREIDTGVVVEKPQTTTTVKSADLKGLDGLKFDD